MSRETELSLEHLGVLLKAIHEKILQTRHNPESDVYRQALEDYYFFRAEKEERERQLSKKARKE